MKINVLASSCLIIMLALAGCGSDGTDGKNGVDGVNGTNGTNGANGNNGVDGSNGSNGTDGLNAPRQLQFDVVGRFATGVYGKSAAEIVQYHKASQRAFAINGANNHLESISLSSLPTSAVTNAFSDNSLSSTSISTPDQVNVMTANGVQMITLGAINSVAIHADLMAVAIAAANKTDAGAVLFYQLDSAGTPTFLKAVQVGALPDMVTFSPDGNMALVANEGEPSDDYSADPEGSISVVAINNLMPADQASTLDFDDMVFSSAALSATDYDTDAKRRALLAAQGVKFAAPAGTTVAQDLEPEYITVSKDSKTAYVSLQENNALAIINLDNMHMQVRGLGFKDWSKSSLDVTDKDGVANFQSIPHLYGMYQPDTIATYNWNGANFVVTANEGDSRDYSAYSEEVRVKDLTLTPEMQAIYDQFGGKNGLGRLKVTTALGDSNGDGVYESLYSFGGRSFSIFDQLGNLVFDSGDAIERITAGVLGSYFNSAHTENTGDNRSDDKGPEPEALDLGVINGRTYAFIGLERVGGIVTYDISNPYSPSFVNYVNNRNFSSQFELDDDLANPCDTAEGMDCSQVPQTGDLGPESIKFISAEDSPTHTPLLLIGNEVSGSVTVYQISEKM